MINVRRTRSLRPARQLLAVGAGLLAVFLFIGALWKESAAVTPNDRHDPAVLVGMTNTLKFTPTAVTVQVGETVRWTNTSLVVHTVTADPAEATMEGSVQLPEGAAPFDSGHLDPEATFEQTFQEPGTYRYFCIPHEAAEMRGTVVVEASR